MRIIFMGTPEFAVPSLQQLYRSRHTIQLVVTQPDRPAGRGKKLVPSPVKEAAIAFGLPVRQPERLSTPEIRQEIEVLQPDAVCVVAFGQKIPRWLLGLPRHGCINVHPSLLPRWRGASPVAATLLAGDSMTGVTTMLLDEGWDTGPLLLQVTTPVGQDENAGELEERLAHLGARLLLDTLDGLEKGSLVPKPQPEEGVTYAPKVTDEEGRLDFTRPAEELVRRIRAFTPDPGAFTFLGSQRFKIWKAHAATDLLPGGGEAAEPGQVVSVHPALTIRTGDGLLVVDMLQPAGKRPMSAADYLRGHPLPVGARFTSFPEGGTD
ncbi:MAG: methionyl-tRNA formyltransferase [Limnochordales bacterium]|nr:methionyl-tRNA formyltransferase [Limnochordales bacterium]